MSSTFRTLGLSERTLRALDDMGYQHPTPIQAATIPLLMQDEDVIGQAQTGTGKTAAFGIPMVEHVDGKGIQALVLCPTRELAAQVTEELNALGAHSDFKAVSVFGGVGMGNQVGALKAKSTTCVVACPGRLLDHLRSNPNLLAGVRTLVLDEADRMLDMGFLPDVERVLKHVPPKRQTMLFSATMPAAIRKLADQHLRTPETVRTGEDSLAAPLSEQSVVYVKRDHKFPTLVSLLGREGDPRAIVFTRTKHLARRLGRRLAGADVAATSLHGDLTQGQRERALDAFRDGKARVLVATDVAARGLDIPDVTHVINYDVPEGDVEAYVHRVGRTGRNGKAGRAFTFVEPGQDDALAAIERLVDRRLPVDTVQVDPRLLEDSARKAAAGRAAAGGGRGRPQGRSNAARPPRGGMGGRSRSRARGGRA